MIRHVGQDKFTITDITAGSTVYINKYDPKLDERFVGYYKVDGVGISHVFVEGITIPITEREIIYINCREEID